MARGFQVACRCGAVRLDVDVPAASAGTRVRCYCTDCQTAARLHAEGDDILSPAGGTDIWQTTPDRLTIPAGADRLVVLRLSPKGLFRWHAACCGTPLVNTLPRLGLPFAGVVLRQSALAGLTPLLGPVRCHAFTASARPGGAHPASDQGLKRAGAAVLRRMVTALLAGRAGITPLRTADARPIAPVRVVPPDRRQAARPVHRR